ncbi:hypothetical protein [uncultured Ilyobacter sp.]|uniref:hypothetical protein n=1 Tax=uncultured Ilyobacter sp. TaxID=544433 RepID=UPI0029F477FC|nr:hypothetical protein [uncultured Ilyobacter sp.]
MTELAKYILKEENLLPCDNHFSTGEIEKYILKKGNVSPCRKYTSKSDKEYYTLWKKINKRSEMTGDIIFSYYKDVEVNQNLENWGNKNLYLGKRLSIY